MVNSIVHENTGAQQTQVHSQVLNPFERAQNQVYVLAAAQNNTLVVLREHGGRGGHGGHGRCGGGGGTKRGASSPESYSNLFVKIE
jgi:hypothetical protein